MNTKPTPPPSPLGSPSCSLILADCLEAIKNLPDKSVDAIITDLPYGTTACKWDAVIPFAPMWDQVRRVLKPSGVFVTTASQPFTSALVMSNLENFQCEWVWHKSKPSGVAFKNQPMRNHESVLVFGKVKTFNAIMEAREGFTAKSIARFESGKNFGTYRNHGNSTTGMGKTELKPITEKRKPTTVKRFASVPNRLGTLHPTQKPVELMRYLVRTYTNPGDLVLDPCMGSGTTCLASKLEGRNSIGIEQDPEHFETARKRIEAELAQGDLFRQNPKNMPPPGRHDSPAQD